MSLIHKEGRKAIGVLMLALALPYAALRYFAPDWNWMMLGLMILGTALLGFFLWFFRNPDRKTSLRDLAVLAPADGKVVVVEEIHEHEYFKKPKIQISIFMSPLNVHVNRYPISGAIVYAVHHPGKYLVAWNPKSSLLNERSSVVIEHPKHGAVMYRQIAGALARRICVYARQGGVAKQGEDSGFIKFGSRVDVFLEPGTEILVKPGDRVVGNRSVLARFTEV